MTRRRRASDDWAETRAGLMADPIFAEAFHARYPYAAIGNALLELRADRGLTQQELADAVGTTQSVIARVESGRHPVGTKFLTGIAESLGLAWRPVFDPLPVASPTSSTERAAPPNVVSLFGSRPSPPAVGWRPAGIKVRAVPEAQVAEALSDIQERIDHVRGMFDGAPHHNERMTPAPDARADVG